MAFEINLTTREARREVSSLSMSVVRLGQIADATGAKLKSNIGRLGGASQLKNISAQIQAVNNNLTNMSQKWEKAYSAAAVGSSRTANAVRSTTKQVRTGRVAMDKYGDSVLTVSQKAAVLRSGMLALGTHVGIFTANTLLAATATYGTVKAIQAIISVGSEFTQALAETAAVMGTSRDQLGGLTSDMLRLAEITKFTTTEVAQASTVLAKTGMKQADVAEALLPTLNLAAIGSMEMAKAADIAANSMFGFQLKTSDLERVVDTLAFTATNSNTSVQQLGVALSYAAPVAAAANADFSEVNAMLAVMADSGVKASRAGTTLRRAYVNLLDPAGKAASVLSDLGVRVRDSNGEMRSMVTIMTELTEAGMSSQDISRIFGVRAAPGMISIWKDIAKGIAGAESKLGDFAKRQNEVTGSGNRMREAMEDNLIDIWKKFKSAVSVKATEAFLLIEDGLKSGVESMTEFVRELGSVEVNLKILAEELRPWGDLFRNSLGAGVAIVIEGWDKLAQSWLNLIRIVSKGEIMSWGEAFQFVGQSIKDLPMNIAAIAKILGTLAGSVSFGFTETLPLAWKETVAKMQLSWIKFTDYISNILYSGLNSVFKFFGDKFSSVGEWLNIDKFKRAGKLLQSMDFSSDSSREIAELKLKIALLRQEHDEKDRLRKQVLSDSLQAIYVERDATIAMRDARVSDIKAIEKRRRGLESLAKQQRESFRDSVPQPSVGLSSGRLPTPDYLSAESFTKSARDDLKALIKEQKNSVKATIQQIKHLEKLGQISPWEAATSSLGKYESAIQKITAEYEKNYSALIEGAELLESSDYKQLGRAKELREAAQKLTRIHQEQTAAMVADAQTKAAALDSLNQKYETVTDQYGSRVQASQGVSGFAAGEQAASQIRDSQRSPSDELKANFEEQNEILEQAFWQQYEMQLDAQNRMYMSEQEYLFRKNQLHEDYEKSRLSRSAAYYSQEAKMQQSANMARAQGIAGGVAAMTSEGAKVSKKLFELNKKARIAQILLDTPAAISGAYTMGAVLGGPILGGAFAVLATLNQAALLKQARAATFDGGGGASFSPSTGATPAPSMTSIQPMSDALFNQTDTGGQQNTYDSSQSTTEINFNINAVDARGVTDMIQSQRNNIIGIVQSAYSERGRRGGPLV